MPDCLPRTPASVRSRFCPAHSRWSETVARLRWWTPVRPGLHRDRGRPAMTTPARSRDGSDRKSDKDRETGCRRCIRLWCIQKCSDRVLPPLAAGIALQSLAKPQAPGRGERRDERSANYEPIKFAIRLTGCIHWCNTEDRSLMIVMLSYLSRVQSEPLAACRQWSRVRWVPRVSRSAGLGGPKGAFRR